jgi:hypothetical protein
MTSDGAKVKVMVELPEVARRRLSRPAASEGHPDAGLLTAFVEGTLARTHRDEVLTHLIACSDCNRLVAIIAPERERTPVVQPIPARRGWFAWAPLRWAGAAAAAAVIVSAIWIGRIDEPASVPAPPSIAVERTPSPSMTAQLSPVPVVVSPVNPATEKRPQQPRELAKSPAVPASPAPVDSATATFAESRPAVPGDVRDQSSFQTSVISGVNPQQELPLSAAEPLHAPPKPDAAPLIQPVVPVPPPAHAIGPIWSVSDSGVLQKSNDSGQTWATVPVPTGAPLRAVSVLGQNIWIGGDRGALYHSTDGGQNWVAVVPISDGKTLSADVVRIAFSDPGHGWVATRNGDIWTTRDSGANWSLK